MNTEDSQVDAPKKKRKRMTIPLKTKKEKLEEVIKVIAILFNGT
jgi:hypothetical protein